MKEGQLLPALKQVMRATKKISSRPFWALVVAFCFCGPFVFYLSKKPCFINLLEKQGFFEDKSYFVPIKIEGFSQCNSPQIKVDIENQEILSEVDLGWKGGIAIPQTILRNLSNKTYIGHYSFSGLTGKIYESDVYELPQMHIGKMKIFPMRAREESLEFLADSILKKGDQDVFEEVQGRVGWGVFKSFNLLLDCKHSAIVVCDSLITLRKQGFFTDSFVEAPLLLDRDSIDFKVVTEAGSLRCMLDTGSTWNLLNKDLQNQNQDHRVIDLDLAHKKEPTFNHKNENLLSFNLEDQWETKAFQIDGHEFGPMNFVKMKSPLDFDAIIGMEFIDHHLIFIDFRNEKIYFSKLPEERSLFARGYDFLKNLRLPAADDRGILGNKGKDIDEGGGPVEPLAIDDPGS